MPITMSIKVLLCNCVIKYFKRGFLEIRIYGLLILLEVVSDHLMIRIASEHSTNGTRNGILRVCFGNLPSLVNEYASMDSNFLFMFPCPQMDKFSTANFKFCIQAFHI